MKNYGTPAAIKPYDEHWSFSKTRCFLLSKKLINKYNKLPNTVMA